MDRHEEIRNDRLVSLLPAIRRRVAAYVSHYPECDLDCDDVFQEAAVSFLRRAQDDAAFLDRPDEEIARRVTMDGWNAARRRRKSWQDGRLVPLELDGDDRSLMDTIPADAPNPEEEAVKTDLAGGVQERIAGLRPNYQTICRRLMGGSTQKAALEAIGTQKQAWSHYRRHLRHAFASMAL